MSETTEKRRGLPSRVRMRHEPHFVEELAARPSDPVGEMLPLGSITPDPRQPRSNMGDLDELAASIRDKGVLEPILVRPEGPTGGYRIISGERRFRAAMDAGLVEIPAIIMQVSEDEALEIALVENLQRKDLTPFEEAEGYHALGERYGYTHEQIAEAVGRSRSAVTESLALLQVPKESREAALALGVESKSLLLELVKASGGDPQAFRTLMEQAAQHGLTRDDVRARNRSSSSSGKARRKPHVFKFQAPDRTFSLALRFRKSEVERSDLISALEAILEDLRSEQS